MSGKDNDIGRVAEQWGSWEDAEQASHAEFRRRSPRDRLAWLEDLLQLRHAVQAARKSVTQQDSAAD